MKKFDLITLKNEEPYYKHNLEKDMHGIILENNLNTLKVLFFNPKNQGEYIVAKINACDVVADKEKLPENILNELSLNLKTIIAESKEKFETPKIKTYDTVELLVEDKKYNKFGIHKGDTGCVMEDYAVQNCVEVDFSGIDENGECYGDCISVEIDDLKVIK